MELLRGIEDKSNRKIKVIPHVLIVANKHSNLRNDKGIKTSIPWLRVRSKEEARIVQALVDLGIKFEYERWKVVLYYGRDDELHSTKEYLVPDFYLPELGIFIEHFGMYKEKFKGYFKDTQKKVQYYIDSNIKFIYTLPEDLDKDPEHLKKIIKQRIQELK